MKKNIFTDDIKRIFENLSLKEKNYLRNKRILILGSNGFIGRYFLYFFDYLNRHKYNLKIDCYDNGISSATLKNELKNIRSANISFYKKDINKIKFKKKYNIILFLAGIATPSIYKKYPLETLWNTLNQKLIGGTLTQLELDLVMMKGKELAKHFVMYITINTDRI